MSESNDRLSARYDVLLPSRERLGIMKIAINAACEIRENISTLGEEQKEDAALAVAAILSAIDMLNRRSVSS